MKDAISAKKEDVTNNIIASKETLNELYNIVNANAEAYKSLGISISNYSEYVNKEYIDGTFLRKIKSIFNNNKDNLDVVNLLSFAELQYKINKLEDVERHYERMLNLSYFEYKDLIYAFLVNLV